VEYLKKEGLAKNPVQLKTLTSVCGSDVFDFYLHCAVDTRHEDLLLDIFSKENAYSALKGVSGFIQKKIYSQYSI